MFAGLELLLHFPLDIAVRSPMILFFLTLLSLTYVNTFDSTSNMAHNSHKPEMESVSLLWFLLLTNRQKVKNSSHLVSPDDFLKNN